MQADRLIFARFFRTDPRRKFRHLWDNGWNLEGPYSFLADAEFDILCRLAYFCGEDGAEQIDRLYRRSAVYQQHDNPDLPGTIERAIQRVKENPDSEGRPQQPEFYKPAPEDADVRDELGEGPLCDLARDVRIDAPEYEHCFRLARHIKGRPELHAGASEAAIVEEYSGLIGRDFEEFYAEFDRIQRRVKYGEGQSPWDIAVRLSETEQYPVGFTPGYQRFCSIFWHLSHLNGGEFHLNRKGLLEVFGKSEMTYTRWKDRMIEVDKLAVCLDATWDSRNRKAQRFRWIAAEPVVL